MKKEPNKPDSANPAIASRLHSGHHRRGVGQPDRCFMRVAIIYTVVLALITGCGRAKFVAPSSGYVELATHNGFLWTIPGKSLLDDGTMGAQQNLLYALVVCPDLAANEKGAETSYGGRVNSYVSHWGTSTSRVAVAVDWDKHTDTVKIAGQTFGRSTGRVFVVRRDRSGSLSSTQLPSPPRDLGPDHALRYIQQHMSTDAVVTSIRLPHRD
jgi:hypothetical protein